MLGGSMGVPDQAPASGRSGAGRSDRRSAGRVPAASAPASDRALARGWEWGLGPGLAPARVSAPGLAPSHRGSPRVGRATSSAPTRSTCDPTSSAVCRAATAAVWAGRATGAADRATPAATGAADRATPAATGAAAPHRNTAARIPAATGGPARQERRTIARGPRARRDRNTAAMAAHEARTLKSRPGSRWPWRPVRRPRLRSVRWYPSAW